MRRVISLLWPFLLLPAFVFATAEGILNFGGGEKDIFLAIPLALLAVLYFLTSLVLWWRGMAPGRATWLAGLIALGLVIIMWVGLFLVSLFFPPRF